MVDRPNQTQTPPPRVTRGAVPFAPCAVFLSWAGGDTTRSESPTERHQKPQRSPDADRAGVPSCRDRVQGHQKPRGGLLPLGRIETLPTPKTAHRAPQRAQRGQAVKGCGTAPATRGDRQRRGAGRVDPLLPWGGGATFELPRPRKSKSAKSPFCDFLPIFDYSLSALSADNSRDKALSASSLVSKSWRE